MLPPRGAKRGTVQKQKVNADLGDDYDAFDGEHESI
jgi:hypothetical protein